MLIVVGIEFVVERRPGVGHQRRRDRGVDQFVHRNRQYRPVADGEKRHTKAGKNSVFYHRLRSETGDGIITVTARELMEEMDGARPRRW